MTLAAALGACAVAAAMAESPSVSVRVLERHTPASALVSRVGERHVVSLQPGALLLDGAPVPEPLELARARWHIRLPGAEARAYHGSPSFRVEAGRLAIVVRMGIEEYVAAVVASETTPGTPLEALKAQAVATRSYALASHGRHGEADLCDLAHCQVLSGEEREGHRDAARAAARATAGEVLALPSGRVAVAPFHAACGGHTADPRELFGRGETGGAAVPDPGCAAEPWTAAIPLATFTAVATALLAAGEDGPASLAPGDPVLRRGAGGYVVQVGLGERLVGRDAFSRRLDGAMGYGVVRSSRFELRAAGGTVLLSGSGIGHGVGLCQAGAARLAAQGQGYRSILRHYFPEAQLASRGR